MKCGAIICVMFGALVLASQLAFGQGRGENLLINGSFEEGPKVNRKAGYKALDAGSTEIKGWTVIKGQIDYCKEGYPAADGKACLDLHGSPGFGGVEQTFATVEGKNYRVTLSLSATPGFGPQMVGVEAGREKASFEVLAPRKEGASPTWATKTWSFVAVGDKTTLKIYTLERKKNPYNGPVLDQVSVGRVGK